MPYTQQYFTWIGHSVNDAPAPSAVTYSGYFKFDTDIPLMSYSNGTIWVPYAYGPLAVEEFKNKFIDVRQNHLYRFARLGAYSPSTNPSNASDTWGTLRGMVSVGTPIAKNIGTLGIYHRFATYGTVADDVAGVLKLDGYTTMRNLNPLIRFGIRFNPNPSSNRRMFVGYGAQRMLTTTTNTIPLGSGESGFLFGHGASDSVFHIFHNDATGPCVKLPTSVSLPAVATNYILEILANDAAGSFTWTLYSVLSNGHRGTVVTNGTGTVTSRIPASLTGLYMQNLVMGSDTVQQFNEPYFIEVY